MSEHERLSCFPSLHSIYAETDKSKDCVQICSGSQVKTEETPEPGLRRKTDQQIEQMLEQPMSEREWAEQKAKNAALGAFHCAKSRVLTYFQPYTRSEAYG